MNHPLDNPIWTALSTRQSAQAQMIDGVRRYAPAFAPFAASADGSQESYARLVELVPDGGQVVLQQDAIVAPPPGLRQIRCISTVQMMAHQVVGPSIDIEIEELCPTDAPDMLALAQLTKPGPFAERTPELGRFVGVRHQGSLIAMAGERMKADAFTEISGVCTHPDHRGKGYAAALITNVADDILARGETPFLHAFADNTGAIALYERMGFATRWKPWLMAFERA